MIAPLTENYTCTAGLAYSSRSISATPLPRCFCLSHLFTSSPQSKRLENRLLQAVLSKISESEITPHSKIF